MGIPVAPDSNTITILTAIISTIVPTVGLGWWLSGRFRKIETATRDRLDELSEMHREQLNAHEHLDQKRHEENLERFRQSAERGQARHEENLGRFSDIRAALAKAGLGNGANH